MAKNIKNYQLAEKENGVWTVVVPANADIVSAWAKHNSVHKGTLFYVTVVEDSEGVGEVEAYDFVVVDVLDCRCDAVEIPENYEFFEKVQLEGKVYLLFIKLN